MLHLRAKCLVHLSLFFLLKKKKFSWTFLWHRSLLRALIKFDHPGEDSSEKNNTLPLDTPRILHQHHKGHGFKPCSSLNFNFFFFFSGFNFTTA